MLDYGQTHPTSNVPANNARGAAKPTSRSMGGQNITAGACALRWAPSSRFEINISADYTRENSTGDPERPDRRGRRRPNRPVRPSIRASPILAVNANGDAIAARQEWPAGSGRLPFRPAASTAATRAAICSATIRGSSAIRTSWTRMAPTQQAPYKPYFALPITAIQGLGRAGQRPVRHHRPDANLVYIGSYREYESKFGQDQDGTPGSGGAARQPAQPPRVQLGSCGSTSRAGDGLFEGTLGGYYLDQKGTYTARVDLNYVDPAIDFLHGPDTTPSTTKALFARLTVHPTELATGRLHRERPTLLRSDHEGLHVLPAQSATASTAGPGFPPACESLPQRNGTLARPDRQHAELPADRHLNVTGSTRATGWD